MKSREIVRTKGQWPDLTDLIGGEVISTELRASDAALVLTFRSSAIVIVPAHWQYSSCLLSVSSTEFESPNNDPQNVSELVGLCGATLTAIESDEHHFDIVLGSISISVTPITPPNP